MSFLKNIKFGKNTIITTLVITSLALVGFGVTLQLNENNSKNAQAAYNAGANRYDDSLTALGQTATYTYNYENTSSEAAPGYFEIALSDILGGAPGDVVTINSITDTFPVDGTTFVPLSGATTITTTPANATYFVGTDMKVRVSPQSTCVPQSGSGCTQADIPALIPGKLVLQMQIKSTAATNTSIIDGQGKIYFPNGFDMNAIGWRVNVNYTAGATTSTSGTTTSGTTTSGTTTSGTTTSGTTTTTLGAGTSAASGTTGSPLSPITGLTGDYSGAATLTLPGGGTINGDIAGGTFTPTAGQNIPSTSPLTGNSTLTPTGTNAPAAIQIPTTITAASSSSGTTTSGTTTSGTTTSGTTTSGTTTSGTTTSGTTTSGTTTSGTTTSGTTTSGTTTSGTTTSGTTTSGTTTSGTTTSGTTTSGTTTSGTTTSGTTTSGTTTSGTTTSGTTTSGTTSSGTTGSTLTAGSGLVTGTLGGLLNPITGLGGTYTGAATLTLPGGSTITGTIANNTFTPATGQTVPTTISTSGTSTLTPSGSGAPAAITLATTLTTQSTTGTPITLSNIGNGTCSPTSITIGSAVSCTFPITGATSIPSGGIAAIVNTATGGYASCTLSGTTLTCNNIPTSGATAGSQGIKLSVANGTYTQFGTVTLTTATSTSTSGTTTSGTTTSGTTTSGTTTSGTTTSSNGSSVSLNVANPTTYLVSLKAVPEQIAIGGAISFQGKVLSGPGSVSGQTCEFYITKPNGTKLQINQISDSGGICTVNLSSAGLISLLGIDPVYAQSNTASLISGIATDFNTIAGSGSAYIKLSGNNATSNTANWRVTGAATTGTGKSTALARTGGVLWISVGLGLALIAGLIYFGLKTRKSKLDESRIDLLK